LLPLTYLVRGFFFYLPKYFTSRNHPVSIGTENRCFGELL
jgi:hypothetical protein